MYRSVSVVERVFIWRLTLDLFHHPDCLTMI